MTLLIRLAREDDAALAVAVLRRSISELCREDHRDDPAVLASWLANKTRETWSVWLERRDASLYVAEEGGALCGVGMVQWDGEVLLNYVAPEMRFKGVSKALLAALEEEATGRGATSMTLESTRTACRFYRANGYAPESHADPLRMTKSLPA